MIINNCIEWCFEKYFDEYMRHNSFFNDPYKKIYAETFDNPSIIKIIRQTNTFFSDEFVSQYLKNYDFINRLLKKKIKNKLYISIILNNQQETDKIIEKCKFSDNNLYQSLKLAIINNNFNTSVKLFSKNKNNNKTIIELLEICTKYGYNNLFFYIIKNFEVLPNSRMYNNSVCNDEMDIISYINDNIGLSKQNIDLAFKSNHTSVIKFIIETSIHDNIKIDPNLSTYPILNENYIILELLEKYGIIDWHHELYSSALLSGSIKMCHLVEEKIKNISIHTEKILDLSRCKRKKNKDKKNPLIMDDIIYYRSNKKYYSHTMNYAIQSLSLDIVKYIHSLDYGITLSNIITAIRQSTPEILDFVCDKYQDMIPEYIYYYFGIESFIDNKYEKICIIMNTNKIIPKTINTSKTSKIKYLYQEMFHIENIRKNKNVSFTELDIDYAMSYHLFFGSRIDKRDNYIILTKIRAWLVSNSNDLLFNMYSEFGKNNSDIQQLIIDTVTIFGSCKQLIDLYKITKTSIYPSTECIMEIMCYSQIGKLCYLKKNIITNMSDLKKIFILSEILDDTNIKRIFNVNDAKLLSFSKIVFTGKKEKIINWLSMNPNYIISDIKIIKMCIEFDDDEIISNIKIDNNIIDRSIEYASELFMYNIVDILNKNII